MTHTLSNGIILDTDGFWAADLQRYARNKGLADVRVFLATHPDGSQSYLLCVGERAEFESQQYEAVAVRIDMIKADREMPQ